MLNKGQFRLWIEAVGGGTEASLSTGCSAFMREPATRSGLHATRPGFCNGARFGVIIGADALGSHAKTAWNCWCGTML
jgi:hypothetical protein